MQEQNRSATRREFLAAGAAGAVVTHSASAASQQSAPISVPTMKAASEAQPEPTPTPLPPGKRLGFAVVGLGELGLTEVLPAFGQCRYARLTALVSGDEAKAKKVADQYGISHEHVYSYDNFDRIANDNSVDIVYIILPNSMHREFTVRAAQAGKHVLCEKPMATTSADCEAMIKACESAKRLLMIAYRCQYEPHHRELIRLARSHLFGPMRLIRAVNGQNQGPANQWRHKKDLAGGGSLPDVGIYCLNAARYITGEEPTRVTAQILTDRSDPRFKEVEDRIAFQLRFPSGVLAACQSFYSAHESRRCRVLAEKGWLEMDPAFSYQGLTLTTSSAIGKAEHLTTIKLPEKNHFALEMDHMAERVARGVRPHTPGEEGLQDIRIIEAIYQAAREEKPIDLAPAKARDSTRGPAPDSLALVEHSG